MHRVIDNPIHGSQKSARNPSLFLFSTLLAKGIDKAHQTAMIKAPAAMPIALSKALAPPSTHHRTNIHTLNVIIPKRQEIAVEGFLFSSVFCAEVIEGLPLPTSVVIHQSVYAVPSRDSTD